jgi:mitogen-activated protein kinase 1/3
MTTPAMDERLANFVVGSSYQVLDVIGEGAYGIVWCARRVGRRTRTR